MLGLITGANRGLGLELVRLGLAQGDSILAACRNTDGEQMTELLTLKTDYPEFLEILQMDVTKEEEVKEAADKVRKKYGHIDFLINNAGVLFEKMKMPGDCIRDLDIDMLRRNLEVNVVGTALVCKYFIEQLYRSVCPCIMNITSEAAHLSPKGYNYPAYSVSKYAANMYTQKLRNFLEEERKELHMRIYMIHPGRMDTAMGKENAQIHPKEAAEGIYAILSGRKEILPMEIPFIDYKGRPMPC